VPSRVRRIDGQTFAFIQHRFLRDGFFSSLTDEERSLYFFLVLAGDRNGVSFYAYDRLCSILEVTLDRYIEARNALITKDLIAFDGSRFQVLSLPPMPVQAMSKPLTNFSELLDDDPATIRQSILNALELSSSDR
jgi:hypothetical protein